MVITSHFKFNLTIFKFYYLVTSI